MGLRTMKRPKDETLSIRTSADIKQLLKLAAEREHRSVASMVEVLVLTYAEQHALTSTASLGSDADMSDTFQRSGAMTQLKNKTKKSEGSK